MKYWILIIIAFVLFSCENTENKKIENNNLATKDTKTTTQKSIDIVIKEPQRGMLIKYDDSLKVSLSLTNVDSIQITINNNIVYTMQSKTNCILPHFKYQSGVNNILFTAYKKGEEIGTKSTYVVEVSNKKAQEYKVNIIKKYPHNVKSYTQGLFYTDNYLYEGTGQYGESSLSKLDLQKNELIQSYNLPKNVFGEGIVRYKDKIYQLTWQSKIAYEYDFKTFSKIKDFSYDTEGWGITNYDKERLIMSDGSSSLYIIEPETFSVISQFQVVDNLGPITYLNELEMINGKIWANVYLTNTIVIINPKTGFVEQKLDLKDLVPNTYANANDNVLNGIAYDKKKNKIYVTGKRWPVLYEIEIKK